MSKRCLHWSPSKGEQPHTKSIPSCDPLPPAAPQQPRPIPLPAPTSSTREHSTALPMSLTREPPQSFAPPPTQAPNPPSRSSNATAAPILHSPRRSSCQRSAPNRLGYNGQQGRGYLGEPSAWLFPECGLLPPPLAYKASVSDPDSLSYDEGIGA